MEREALCKRPGEMKQTGMRERSGTMTQKEGSACGRKNSYCSERREERKGAKTQGYSY